MVYDDAEQLYTEVRRDGETLLEEAFTTLFPKSCPLTASAPKSFSELVAFNTTFFPRRDVVEVPVHGGSALRSKVVQVAKDGTKGYALMSCAEGGHLARCVGLFADCMPPSGTSFPICYAKSQMLS